MKEEPQVSGPQNGTAEGAAAIYDNTNRGQDYYMTVSTLLHLSVIKILFRILDNIYLKKYVCLLSCIYMFCVSLFSGLQSRPGHVKKLPVTCG